MDEIATFELPEWIHRHEATTKHDLSGSAAPALSIEDLISLSNNAATTKQNLNVVQTMKLAYGDHSGNHEARENIAALYQSSGKTKIGPDNVLMTNGASGANQLILQALVKPKQSVICVYPTYGQLLEVPRAAGADVSYWKLNPNNGWKLDFSELEQLVKPGKTKMIILNNPSNPTGSCISNDLQENIVELARRHNIIIFSDEVFRPLFHDGSETPKSLLDWGYENTIVSGSMSKAYGMPGTRTGWLASLNKSLLRKCEILRAYSIAYSTSMVEVVVAEALSDRCRPMILKQNHGLASQCLKVLDDFVSRNQKVVHWTRPVASSITLIQFKTRNGGKPVDDVEFCTRLQAKEGVLFAPASLCFGTAMGQGKEPDFNGYVRCHFVRDPSSLAAGLEAVERFLQSDDFTKVPAAPENKENGINGAT